MDSKTRVSTWHFVYDAKAGDYKFDFGKYRGEWLGKVAKEHPEYLRWMYFDADFGELNNQIIEDACSDLNIDLSEAAERRSAGEFSVTFNATTLQLVRAAFYLRHGVLLERPYISVG